jgi:hypothetical protein
MSLTGIWRHRPSELSLGGGALSASWGGGLLHRLLRFAAPTLELRHLGGALVITERSFFGALTRELRLDGVWRAVPQAWGPPVEARAAVVPGTGAVRVESRCGGGTLLETLRLLPLGDLQQALEFAPGDAALGCAAEAVVRTWDWAGAGAAPAAAETAHAAVLPSGDGGAPEPWPPPREGALPPILRPRTPPANVATAAAASGAGAAPWEPPNFSGSWRVAKEHSDPLEPLLRLMGMGWLLAKVAGSLDVTKVVTHDPEARTVGTVEKALGGVLNTNDMVADGVPVSKRGADGRTARVTCAVSAAPPHGHPLRALPAALAGAGTTLLGCLRIVTELPDGVGESDCVWALHGEAGGAGTVIAEHVVFRKPAGGGHAVAHRVMLRESGSVTPLPSPTKARRGSPHQEGAASGAASPAPSPVPSPHGPRGAAAALSDPCFVSLAGVWAASVAGGAAGACPAAAAAAAALADVEALGGGALAAALRALLPPVPDGSSGGFPPSALPQLSLRHEPGVFCCTVGWAGTATGGGAVEVSLDGSWRPVALPGGCGWLVARARATEGAGGGETWLGEELGDVPAALAPGGPPVDLESIPGGTDVAPFFSAAIFSHERYAAAAVELLLLLPVFESAAAAGAAAGAAAEEEEAGAAPSKPRLRVMLRADLGGASAGSAPPPPLHLALRAECMLPGQRAPRAHEALLLNAAECPRCGGAPAAGVARVKAERARVRHVRALLLERRAAADGARKALLLRRLHEAAGEGGVL